MGDWFIDEFFSKPEWNRKDASCWPSNILLEYARRYLHIQVMDNQDEEVVEELCKRYPLLSVLYEGLV